MSGEQLLEVDVEQIVAGDNDRVRFRDDDIARLAASIAEVGLLQPPTLRKVGERFEIVAGERRFRAVCTLGWSKMDALVRDLDDRTASNAMLAENTGRVELDPIEEALAYAKRVEQGSTPAEVAAVAGVRVAQVQWRLDLLRLTPEIRELVRAGEIGPSLAWELSQLDGNRQGIAVTAIVRQSLRPAEAISLIRRLHGEQQQEGMFDAAAFELQAEELATSMKRKASRSELVSLVEAFLTTGGDYEIRNRARQVLDSERTGA